MLAVDQINADKRLLPGYTLEYDVQDSGCSAKQGLVAVGKMLGEGSNTRAVIGA